MTIEKGQRMSGRTIIAAALAAALALPATAAAHVTLQPNEAAAGGFIRFNVRVPNERDNAGTTKVVVQFPAGFASASYEPAAGWKTTVKKRKAAKPIEQFGETFTQEIDTITWEGGVIRPGQFKDFGISVQVTGKAGDTLTFKALQTYQGGEVVRWIGAADSDEPAPRVEVTAGEEEPTPAPAPTTTPAGEGTNSVLATGGDDDDDDDDSNGLAIAGLVLGGLGLLTGGAAFARSSRPR